VAEPREEKQHDAQQAVRSGERALPSWTEARTTNPDRSLEEQREDLEGWGDATAEPGGDDYLETDAGGSPAMWLAPGT